MRGSALLIVALVLLAPGAAGADGLAIAAGPEVTLVGLAGVALFPELVPTTLAGGHALTIHNAASSVKTLKIMALIAAIGMPFVVTYTAIIYWAFRGRVELSEHGY